MLIWILLVGCAYNVLGEVDDDDDDASPVTTIKLGCENENILLKGIGSRSPFFSDALSCSCNDFKKKLFGEKTRHQGVQSEGGISAKCDKDEDVIITLNLQMENHRRRGGFKGFEIECGTLLEPEAMKGTYSASSEEFMDALVTCGDSSAVVGIRVQESDYNRGESRVILDCVKLEA